MSKLTKDELRDKHIIEALKQLPSNMKNKEGVRVIVRLNAPRGETGNEHIANRFHGLRKKDVAQIPETLLKPFLLKPDDRPNRRNYFSKIYEAYVVTCFLKIVTEIKKDGSEEIITAFRSNDLD